MTPPSSLETLYSALIQGGAAIVALLGGFLLAGMGPLRSLQLGADRTDRELDRRAQKMERMIEEVETARNELDVHVQDRKFVRSRIPLFNTPFPERERILEKMQRTVDELDQQLSDGQRLKETLEASRATRAEFIEAADLLFALIVACIATPAVALWALETDSCASWRSLICILVYALALTKIALYLLYVLIPAPESLVFKRVKWLNQGVNSFLWGLILLVIVTPILPFLSHYIFGSSAC